MTYSRWQVINKGVNKGQNGLKTNESVRKSVISSFVAALTNKEREKGKGRFRTEFSLVTVKRSEFMARD